MGIHILRIVAAIQEMTDHFHWIGVDILWT
jgi:hypothetical protein